MREATRWAAEWCRSGKGPLVMEAATYINNDCSGKGPLVMEAATYINNDSSLIMEAATYINNDSSLWRPLCTLIMTAPRGAAQI